MEGGRGKEEMQQMLYGEGGDINKENAGAKDSLLENAGFILEKIMNNYEM